MLRDHGICHGRQGLHPLVVSCPWDQMSAIDTKSSQQDSMGTINALISAQHLETRSDGTGTALRTRRTEVQLRVGPRSLSPGQSLFLSHSVVILLRRQRKDPDTHSINSWEKVTRVVRGRGGGKGWQATSSRAYRHCSGPNGLQRISKHRRISSFCNCRIEGKLLTPQI